jgi:rubredoxin
MPHRWRCTVCGYIHEGVEPPDVCPVCGADRSLFVLIDKEVEATLLHDLITNFRLHSVVAHFPCGLLPTCGLFLLIYLIVGHPGLETTIYWLLLVVLAVTPVSLASGLYVWQKHFSGRRASIFYKKIGLALILLLLGLIAMLLRFGRPELIVSGGWQSWLYLSCFGVMFGCVVLLGHYGSKLVFQAHGENR